MPKIIAISGEIGWDVWPDDVRRQIEAANGEEIEFQISSPGGYIYDGLEIFNMIRGYSGKTTTVANGMAASMASYLLMAGDIKKATSNAIFMIHNARTFEYGDQNDHRRIANILEGMSNLLGQEYIRQTGKDKKQIQALMADETYYFGNEILEAGFVDEIIEVDEVEPVARAEAVSNASASVAAIIEKMKTKPEDISKIAAALKPVASKKNEEAAKNAEDLSRVETFTNRQSANNQNKMEEQMPTLDEVLAENPSAKNEYDKRLGEAKTNGVEVKQKEIDRIHPLITAEGASAALIEQGFKALKEGGQQVGVFVGIAEYEARQQERANADAADDEQKEDAPAGPEPTNKDKPKNAADIKDLAAELKNNVL